MATENYDEYLEKKRLEDIARDEYRHMSAMSGIGAAILAESKNAAHNAFIRNGYAESLELQRRQLATSERIAGALERIRDCFEVQAEDAAEEAQQIADAIEQNHGSEGNRS